MNDTDRDLLGRHLGGWSPALRAEAEDAPAYFDRFLAMLKVPLDRGALPPVELALIGVAVVGNTANTNWPRLKAYVDAALALGASRQQVRDVLQMVSIMSIHSMTVGIPGLARVLAERGQARPPHDRRRAELRADFEARRGYWHETWDDVLAYAPEMFEAYTAFSLNAVEHGSIEERLRELIYIAIDCVITHLYVPGVEIHARRALDAGATPEQIVSAIEVVVLTGANPYFEAIDRIPGLAASVAEVA